MSWKYFTVILVFFVVAFNSILASGGFIDDARGEDCSTGTCLEVCQYEGLNLLPGTEETNDGRCRRVKCNLNFSAEITECPAFTILEKCKKYKDNTKVPFPYCCAKVCKH